MTLATYKRPLVAAAMITAGLNAGLFFCFSTAIVPGFAHLSDSQYIAATQVINQYIQNPVFFLVFMGAVFILPLAAYACKSEASPRRFRLLLAAAAFYVIGTFGVTMAANVPLNDKLAKVDVVTASPAELTKARTDYVQPWGAWHTVRTVSAVASLALVAIACLPPVSTTNTSNKKEVA